MGTRSFRFELELEKFRGDSRLGRLRSYYFTWKLPNHPVSGELYELILELLALRTKFDLASSFETLETPSAAELSVGALEGKLAALGDLSGPDADIREHCLAHCHILREIESELVQQTRAVNARNARA